MTTDSTQSLTLSGKSPKDTIVILIPQTVSLLNWVKKCPELCDGKQRHVVVNFSSTYYMQVLDFFSRRKCNKCRYSTSRVLIICASAIIIYQLAALRFLCRHSNAWQSTTVGSRSTRQSAMSDWKIAAAIGSNYSLLEAQSRPRDAAQMQQETHE